jgi:TonB family protein
MFRRTLSVAPLILVFAVYVAKIPAPAGPPPDSIDAISERIAAHLTAAKKKRLVVLDLTLPTEKPSALGSWIADRISESLEHSHSELQVIPRSKWKLALADTHRADNRAALKAVGAKTIVRGSFAAVGEDIAFTLNVNDQVFGGKWFTELLGELPLTPEMQATISSPLPQRAMIDGFYKAGTAGIGSPVCLSCPIPDYPDALRVQRVEGTVSLDVEITAEGNPAKIIVSKSPYPMLLDLATKAVMQWRFKPAINSRGERVPVVTPVEVAFRMG